MQKQESYIENRIVAAVPQNLINTKRVFCAKGCSATHYIEGQCFIWESAQRKSIQDLDRRAKEEAKKTPACKDRWKNLRKSDFHIDYDWKNTYKYKNKDTEDYKNLGEDIWTPLEN